MGPMATRRALLPTVVLASLALTACQFGYQVSELVGHYRAEGSRISERLTLHSGGIYFHSWCVQGERRQQFGDWRLEANWIHFDDYVAPISTLPALAAGAERFFIPGPPTLFFWGGPTFFSRELGVEFVWSRGL